MSRHAIYAQDPDLSIVAEAYESADDWHIVAFFGRLHAVEIPRIRQLPVIPINGM